MSISKEPILGQAFSDVLNELHAHAFTGVPGESDPFTLSLLEREYIAYVLACYYQCDHCQRYHGRAIVREQTRVARVLPDWETRMVDATLLLRATKGGVSDLEWWRWEKIWKDYAHRLDVHFPGLAAYIAYAVGIARRDLELMDLAFASIRLLDADAVTLTFRIRDIDRVVVFMKAATSKNRTDPVISTHIHSLTERT